MPFTVKERKMEQLSEKKKRGCPTCDGVDAKSCMRCNGKTRMCDWFNTYSGWSHYTELTVSERGEADAKFPA
jgi:hypothetical protein